MAANRDDNIGESNAAQFGNSPNINASSTAGQETADNGVGVDENQDSSPTLPLYASPRLKGYITLLSSSVYNYISAGDQAIDVEDTPIDWCMVQYDIGLLVDDPRPDLPRIRYAMTAAMITILVTGAVIFIHFLSIAGVGNKLWSKMFGRNSKTELYISFFLSVLWIITTWFNTTIQGPAGSGKDQHNLYFSTWICLFTSFWILEAWSTSTGRASFERFVRSWPNRCPMWIVTFILSFTDFCFVLDASENWKQGLEGYPYMLKYFSRVPSAEWTFLGFVTAITFASSLAWVLAEIFRENKTNIMNTKSDQENAAEGIIIILLTLIWIPTVFISTVPGGAASLLGNLYFTTWSCSFSVVGLLVWWQRNWREGIFQTIEEQQNEYDKAKRAIMRREEKRLASLEEDADKPDKDDDGYEEEWVGQSANLHEMEREESERTDDVDTNANIAIDGSFYGAESLSPFDSVSSSVTVSPGSVLSSSRSLFVSTLQSHQEEDDK